MAIRMVDADDVGFKPMVTLDEVTVCSYRCLVAGNGFSSILNPLLPEDVVLTVV